MALALYLTLVFLMLPIVQCYLHGASGIVLTTNAGGTSVSPQLSPRSALGEESQEAHQLQLCLDAMQTMLVTLERETVAVEDVAAEAQARLAGKSYWARSCSFTSCDATSCV